MGSARSGRAERMDLSSVAPAAIPALGLMTVTFLARGNQAVVQTTYPLVGHQRLHLSSALIGAIAAAYGAVAAIAARALSARLRGMWSVVGSIAGLAVMAAATAALAFTPGRAVFVVAVLAGGAGAGLTFPSLMTMAGRSGGDAERSMVRYAVALSASLCIGPLIEAAVLSATHQSYSAVFWVFVPYPVAGAVATVLWTSPHRAVRRAARGSPSGVVITGSPTADLHGDPALDEPVLLAPVPAGGDGTRIAFRMALLVLVMCEVPFGSVIYFGGVTAHSADHASSTVVALLFSGYFAASLVSRLVLAATAPIRDKVRLARFCCLVMVTGIAVLAVFPGLAPMAVAMIVLGCGDGTTYTLGLTLIVQYSPPSELAGLNGRFSMVENAMAVVVPPIVGVLISVVGYRIAFGSMVAAVLAVGLPASFYRLPSPSPATNPVRAPSPHPASAPPPVDRSEP